MNEVKDDFIGKEFPQNCGDSLFVIEKSNKKQGKIILFKCNFIKYPLEVFAAKGDIIKGKILNPEIENKEFIGKIFPQNCGDDLKVIRKVIKDNKSYFECEFQKYSFKIITEKSKIIKGSVVNSQIEKVEFIDKIHLQNCGDSLRILKKSDKKQNGAYLWECEFINYPCKVYRKKDEIIKGQVDNPEIENKEFINQKFLQRCGDILKVISKTNKKVDNLFLYECEFINYPCKVYALKRQIINKSVDNFNLPWKSREALVFYINKYFFNKKPTLQELAKSLNIAISTIGHKINEFNLREYISYSLDGLENQIKDFINSLNIDIIENYWVKDIQKEIDILIPKFNLGVEINGSYWHSELHKDYLYHQEKSILAQEKGINLIHIFEYEWRNEINQKILKSLIKSKLGIFDQKIFARNCEIKELDSFEYMNFCNENHLQGSCSAKVKLGLFCKEELIQVMSFSLPRFTDKYEWEIIRECSKLGYVIVGGKEKLWKYFLRKYNPSNCLSYCDFSKFTGNSYLKLGFKKERLNKPGFVWWDENTKEVFWRNPYKHKEMKDKYLRIYNCGQLVFVWYK